MPAHEVLHFSAIHCTCIAFVLCNNVTCVVHGFALFWSFLSCVLVGCEFGERESVCRCVRDWGETVCRSGVYLVQSLMLSVVIRVCRTVVY